MEFSVTRDPNSFASRGKGFKFSLRRLRLSLKYRPEILKLILKMRQCIREKNVLLKKLKQQLKSTEKIEHILTPDGTDKCIQKDLDNLETLIIPHTEDILKPIENQKDKVSNAESLIDKNICCDYIIKDNVSQTKTDIPEVYNKGVNIICDKNNILSDEVMDMDHLNKDSVKNKKLVIDDILISEDHQKLIQKETYTQTELLVRQGYTIEELGSTLNKGEVILKDAFTQTDNSKKSYEKSIVNELEEAKEVPLGWSNSNNGKEDKSIAEQVKEVAQSAMEQSGMVYVESAGMYYDYKTGYYYNSELGLYYHSDTGCYYYYSDDQKSFVFHSYPDRSQAGPTKPIRQPKKHRKAKSSDDIENLTKNFSQDENNAAATKPKRRRLTKPKKKTEKVDKSNTKSSENNYEKDDSEKQNHCIDEMGGIVNEEAKKQEEELEDGECSESADEKSDSSCDESCASTETASDDESVAKHHPPCMRVIVRETSLPKLKVGSLFLVTKDGGTIGREGEHHAILLKDYNVSRNHLDIKFNVDKRIYTAVDLGSKNGTILNGVRMSESQEVSAAMEVVHGSTLQLGDTKLLCHIHAGNDTCGHCEPGLIIEAEEKEKKAAYTRTCSVQRQHQLELARLKNKYAPQPLQIAAAPYNDRAEARRAAVGSSHSAEKTQCSDLDTAIAADNKGFKLLEKMGWSKGEGLGKDSQGDTEPIPLISNEGKTGLGAVPTPAPLVTSKIGPATLRLAARTKMLQPPAKAFQQPEDEESE